MNSSLAHHTNSHSQTRKLRSCRSFRVVDGCWGNAAAWWRWGEPEHCSSFNGAFLLNEPPTRLQQDSTCVGGVMAGSSGSTLNPPSPFRAALNIGRSVGRERVMSQLWWTPETGVFWARITSDGEQESLWSRQRMDFQLNGENLWSRQNLKQKFPFVWAWHQL